MRLSRTPALLLRQQRLDALVGALHSARLRPRTHARRVRALLWALDLFAPQTLSEQVAGAVCQLAALRWRQSLDRWRGPDLPSLAAHLLVGVRYPLPGFLLPDVLRPSPAWTARAGPGARLLALLGRGGDVRQAQRQGLVPHTLTRRARHELWLVERAMPLGAAVRVAQVAALGGPAWLGDVLGGSGMRTVQPAAEPVRERLVAWLVDAAGALGPDDVGGIVDYLSAVPVEEQLSACRAAPATVLRRVRRWHAAGTPAHARSAARLPTSGLEPLRLERDGGVWTVRELRTSFALFLEGRVLHHCVATYTSKVASGRSWIFGLRCDGQRRVTVEVSPTDRLVVQAKGRCNRRPTAEEGAVVRRWAAANELQIADYVPLG